VGLVLGAVALERVDSGLVGVLVVEDTGISEGDDGESVDAFQWVPSRGTALGIALDGALLEVCEEEDPEDDPAVSSVVELGVLVNAVGCVATGDVVDVLGLGVVDGTGLGVGGVGAAVVGVGLVPSPSVIGRMSSPWHASSSLSRNLACSGIVLEAPARHSRGLAARMARAIAMHALLVHMRMSVVVV
jgi:hypothetical protein